MLEKTFALSALIALSTVCLPVQAQTRNFLGVEKPAFNGTVPADRPGFGDNSSLVPLGHFVLEAGFAFDDKQGGGNSYLYRARFVAA